MLIVYLDYLQAYALSLPSLPSHAEFLLMDLFESLRPSMQPFEDINDAMKAVREYESKMIEDESSEIAKNLGATATTSDYEDDDDDEYEKDEYENDEYSEEEGEEDDDKNGLGNRADEGESGQLSDDGEFEGYPSDDGDEPFFSYEEVERTVEDEDFDREFCHDDAANHEDCEWKCGKQSSKCRYTCSRTLRWSRSDEKRRISRYRTF